MGGTDMARKGTARDGSTGAVMWSLCTPQRSAQSELILKNVSTHVFWNVLSVCGGCRLESTAS
jgi:hypothetical protein